LDLQHLLGRSKLSVRVHTNCPTMWSVLTILAIVVAVAALEVALPLLIAYFTGGGHSDESMHTLDDDPDDLTTP